MKIQAFGLSLLSSVAVAANTLLWSLLDETLPGAVSDMTSTLGPDGLIYIAGGCNAKEGNVYNSVTTYFDCASTSTMFYSMDPTTKDITMLDDLPRARYRHGAAASGNYLWLVGGRTSSEESIMEIDIYNFETKKWITPFNHTEENSDLAMFSDDTHVYVAGGWNITYRARSSLWRINASSVDKLSIEAMAPLQEARGDIKAVADGKGHAYIAGGFTDVNGFCPPLATVEMYDIAKDEWSYIGPMKAGRGDKALVELEGSVFAIGGEAPLDNKCPEKVIPGETSVVIDDVEQYNATSNTWIEIASIPYGKFRSDATSADGKVFVFGGQNVYNTSCKCYTTSNEILVLIEDDGINDDENESPTKASGAVSIMIPEIVAIVGVVMTMGLF